MSASTPPDHPSRPAALAAGPTAADIARYLADQLAELEASAAAGHMSPVELAQAAQALADLARSHGIDAAAERFEALVLVARGRSPFEGDDNFDA
jgi:hypothetical protein